MIAACGDDDDDLRPSRQSDGGTSSQTPGVCSLSKCPTPEMGTSCCTPYAQCGYDPTGIGLACLPNSGQPLSDRTCVLSECAEPIVGKACCTPYAECGFDPFESGLFCFPIPPDLPPFDAGAPVCEVSSCAEAESGYACCLANGECGIDPFGVGLCFPNLPPEDGGIVLQPISTTPPDDKSVDGQCPSYIGLFGPVWGCCSDFGVCGTFLGETCFLPEGTPISIDPDADAGALFGVLTCKRPK
jgi:hypothetical protein